MKSLPSLDDKTVSRFLYVLIGVHILIMLIATLNQSIWVDEAYTLSEIGQPYNVMIGLLSTGDVHPPLYHLIAKTISGAVTAVLPAVSLITIVKCVSVLPMLLLVVVGLTKVRRDWGDLCGIFFSFCVVAMPKMLYYAVESRMYSWALLFVTLSFLYAYDCAKQPSAKNWVMLSAASALAAWTHYFACLSAVLAYAVLGAWLLLRDKKKLLNWLLSGALVALLYLPQLMVSLKAFGNVSSGFWIEEIGLLGTARFASFPFVFTSPIRLWGITVGGLLALTYAWVCYSYVKNKDKPELRRTYFAFSGAAVFILTVAVGLIISWLTRPLITQRYTFAALGCFWLCFCILLTATNRIRWSNAIITITAALVLIGNLSGFVAMEIRSAQRYDTVNEVLRGMGDNDVIVTDFAHLSGTFDYMTGNRRIYRLRRESGMESSNLFNSVFSDNVVIDSYDDIPEISDTNASVYALLDAMTDQPVEKLNDYLDASGNHAAFIGEYDFDDNYKFNLYRVEA